MSFSVLKFGGTSVANAGSWPLIARLCSKKLVNGKHPVLVLSALSGISNLLEILVNKAVDNNYQSVLEQVYKIHQNFADNLAIEITDNFSQHWQILENVCAAIADDGQATPANQAVVCGMGELLSTTLACEILSKHNINARWLDARHLLTLDEEATEGSRKQYLSAICHYAACPDSQQIILKHHISNDNNTLENQHEGEIVYVTQGFIASNQQGETILLGRGGSDTSAACIASILEADELEIWTDVPGIFSANPHQIPTARLLSELDYDEAQELASTGAKVLHPRAIKPAREAGIAIKICSVLQPELDGTLISNKHLENIEVTAISMRDELVVLTIETSGMWQRSGFLGDVFGIFGKHGISIDLVSTSESNVTVSLDAKANELDRDLMQLCLDELTRIARVNVIEPVASISIIGRNIHKVIPRLGVVIETFGENRIYLISLSSSDLNLTFVVDQKQSMKLMARMHELLIDGVSG